MIASPPPQSSLKKPLRVDYCSNMEYIVVDDIFFLKKQFMG